MAIVTTNLDAIREEFAAAKEVFDAANERRRAAAVAAYVDGEYRTTICRKLGISEPTLTDWVRKAGVSLR